MLLIVLFHIKRNLSRHLRSLLDYSYAIRYTEFMTYDNHQWAFISRDDTLTNGCAISTTRKTPFVYVQTILNESIY